MIQISQLKEPNPWKKRTSLLFLTTPHFLLIFIVCQLTLQILNCSILYIIDQLKRLDFFQIVLFIKFPKNIDINPKICIVNFCPAEGTFGLLFFNYIKTYLANSMIIFTDKKRYSLFLIILVKTNIAYFFYFYSFWSRIHFFYSCVSKYYSH